MNELIEKTGMKLKPLAVLLRVSYHTIRSYSTGRLLIPEDKQKRLKEILEIFEELRIEFKPKK